MRIKEKVPRHAAETPLEGRVGEPYELLAYNNAAGRTVANLDQVDTCGGHRNGLFDGGIGALGYQTAYHVEYADGLLLGTADHDVAVLGVDDRIVLSHVVDANVLCKVAYNIGGGFCEDNGDDFVEGCVCISVHSIPVVEVVAIVCHGLKHYGVAGVTLVVVRALTIDEHMAPINVVRCHIKSGFKNYLFEHSGEHDIVSAHQECDRGLGVDYVVIVVYPIHEGVVLVGSGSDGDHVIFVVEAVAADSATTSGTEGDDVLRQSSEDGCERSIMCHCEVAGEVGVAIAPLQKIVVLGR